MIATSDHARIRPHTSTPSPSGRARSSTTSAGRSSTTASRASVPVATVLTGYPRAWRAARRTVVMDGSSSTTRISSGSGAVDGDGEPEPGAVPGLAVDADAPSVGLDDGLADG